jgi:primosomal protein N' (replication factor Y)
MFAEIVLPIPLDKTFHYGIPEQFAGKVVPGVRVRVPFGKSARVGYCVGLVQTTDVKELKEIGSVVDEAPLIDASLLRLTRWVADYYLCSWGQALEAALPAPVRRESARRRTLHGVELAISVDNAGARLTDKDSDAIAQKRLIRFLLESGAGQKAHPLRALMQQLGITVSPIKSLVKKGVLRTVEVQVDRDPFRDVAISRQEPPPPTEYQKRALDVIFGRKHPCFEAAPTSAFVADVASGHDRLSCAGDSGPEVEGTTRAGPASSPSSPAGCPWTVLIEGVTGSGKTEIYLRVIDAVVKAGRQAIVLVPEVSLTSQAVVRFKARFERVAVMHYQMTDAQRHHEWLRIHEGKVDVVIGARSAIFAPVHRLGLIVVDEEHESSYKQDLPPRYNARDLAVMRGKAEGAMVLLGSATPSLESYHNAMVGKYHHVVLPSRIGGIPMPKVEIVDMTRGLRGKGPFRAISSRLDAQVRQALERDEKVILFLNRRGFYTFLVCARCGYVARCKRCDIAVTYHKQYGKGLCHHCGEGQPLPERCPECHSPTMRLLGTGTEKVLEEAEQQYGSSNIARVDSDSMRGPKSYRKVFTAFMEGELDMLVGTQVIAKGLDIPDVTLVGVVSGDTCLHLRDFRSAERTLQLIMQVAGRSGRGPKGGQVVVQTYNPSHYAIQAAVKHDYESFAKKELELRKELGYPPFGRLVRVVVEGKNAAAVRERARELATKFRNYAANARYVAQAFQPASSTRDNEICTQSLTPQQSRAGAIDILGPAPAPLERIRDRWRWHVLLRSTDSNLLHHTVKSAGHLLVRKKGARVLVDVDPLNML